MMTLGLTITEGTEITITLAGVAALVVFVTVMTWRLFTFTSRTENMIASIRTELSQMLTKDAAAEHAMRMAILNPHIRVPDPRDPLQFIGENARPVVSSNRSSPTTTKPPTPPA